MKYALTILLVIAAAGCTSRKIVLPNGAGSYTSTRFGNKESIGEISFDGKKLTVKGYQSDQVQAIGIAVEAAVRGAVASMVPAAAARSGPFVVPAGFKLVPEVEP